METPKPPQDIQTTDFMALAFAEAERGAALGEVPVGAVLVENGTVIASAHNLVETEQDGTQHAEMIVMREAMRKIGSKRIPNCELFVTLEPCTMCAGAISHARVRRVTFAALDPKGGAVLHGAKFYEQPTCHHRPEIVHDARLEAKCGDILRSFFAARRKNADKAQA